jgi:hypothetical protein
VGFSKGRGEEEGEGCDEVGKGNGGLASDERGSESERERER